jgi:cytochrome c
MKTLKTVILTLVMAGLVFSGVFAAEIDKGKALFNDPKLGGATSGKSCNSCHPDGKGLENAADKKEFNIMGKKQKGLEEAVNFCIEMALKGKAIDPKGKDMANIVAYIKSLAKKPAETPKKKKAIEGC